MNISCFLFSAPSLNVSFWTKVGWNNRWGHLMLHEIWACVIRLFNEDVAFFRHDYCRDICILFIHSFVAVMATLI